MASGDAGWTTVGRGGRRRRHQSIYEPSNGATDEWDSADRAAGDSLRGDEFRGNHQVTYIPEHTATAASPEELAIEAVMTAPEAVIARVTGRGWFSLIRDSNHTLESLSHLLTVLDVVCRCTDPVQRAEFLEKSFGASYSLRRCFITILVEKHYSTELIQVALQMFTTLARLVELMPRLFGPICVSLGKLVEMNHSTDGFDETDNNNACVESDTSLEGLRKLVVAVVATADVPLADQVFVGNYPSGTTPPDSFRDIPIYPRSQDIDGNLPFLRPNIVRGPYNSVEEYLDIQFRLLREDYMIPLREGLRVLRGQKDVHRKQGRNMNSVMLYRRVRYLEPVFNDRNEYVGSRLELRQGRRSQDSFKYGSLLGLSVDELQSFCFFICVRAQSNFVDVIPCNEREYRFLKHTSDYDMVELTGAFYESYRHTLTALKKMTTFPLQSVIVDLSDTSGLPIHWSKHPHIQLPFSIYPDRSYNLRQLPPVNDVKMNSSQYQAFLLAINKQLCLIQGPPGTGKTYVGLKIVQTLLHNQISEKPILVVCYTNHALDQFLEGMLDFTRSLVRVGGRSKSTRLADFTYDRLREETRRRVENGRERQQLRAEVTVLKQELMDIERQIGEAEGWMLISNRSRLGKMYKALTYIDNLDHFLELPRLCKIESTEDKTTIQDAILDSFAETPNVNDLQQEMELLEYSRSKVRVQDIREKIIEQRLKGSRPLGPYAFEQISKKIRYELFKKGKKPRTRLTLQEKWRFYASVHWKIVNETFGERTAPRDPNASGQPLGGFDRLQERLRECRRTLMSRHKDRTNEIAEKSARASEIIDRHTASIISTRQIIGMTTSGAASRLSLLEQIASEIVVVEEAAELLEPHLITVLPQSTKQIILIGDHKQLQPKLSGDSFVLETDFNMTVSLFERMVNNGIPFIQLNEQHRMRDEFIQLLVPEIYPRIKSAPHVFSYPDIQGMAGNLQFLNHSVPECSGQSGGSSKTNLHEIKLICALVRHLLLQGYQHSEIVVLAMYKGQSAEITRSINPLGASNRIRVSTVDDYQGEESNIVIVSFVRSNERGKIGFLKTSNRICVALSRAKMGLFCIGNFLMYRESSDLWRSIIQKLLLRDAIDCGWRLRCPIHFTEELVRTADEMMMKCPMGGCTLQCNVRLDCGHACDSICHGVVRHPECEKPCTYVHPKCGHNCPNRCTQPHGVCLITVERLLFCGHTVKAACAFPPERIICKEKCMKTLQCGHIVEAVCSDPEEKIPCKEACPKTLNCGHPCQNLCSKACTVYCAEMVPITRTCGHEAMSHCYKQNENTAQARCEVKVEVDLHCGHRMSTKCARSMDINDLTKKCSSSVKNVQLKCGHKVSMNCVAYQQLELYECSIEVEVTLPCQHETKVKCCDSEKLTYLAANCERIIEVDSKCGHKVSLACNLSKNSAELCYTEVVVPLICGHNIKLPCNVSKDYSVLDHYTSICSRKVPVQCPAGHQTEVACNQKNDASHVANNCDEIVRDIVAPCKHKVDSRCRYTKKPDHLRNLCKVIRNVSLKCGHSIDIQCNDVRNIKQLSKACHQQIDKPLPCGHIEQQICYGRRGNPVKICKQNCEATLPCGHVCTGNCVVCYAGRYHKSCSERCTRQCSFGHPCKGICSKPCPPCSEPCTRECKHGKCSVQCGQPCSIAKLGCRKVRLDHCPHQLEQVCTAKCCWDCRCLPCPNPCSKRLKCNHTCVGMCGEPCLPCGRCNGEKKSKKLKKQARTRENNLPSIEYSGEPLLTVPGCGHIIRAEVVDTLYNECLVKNEMPLCPTCKGPIPIWRRYNAIINSIYRHRHPSTAGVDEVKARRVEILERVNKRLLAERKVELKKLKQPRGMQNHYTLEILEQLNPRIRQGGPEQLAICEHIIDLLEALVDCQSKAIQALQGLRLKTVRDRLNELTIDSYEALLEVANDFKNTWTQSRLYDISVDATRLKAAVYLTMKLSRHRQEQLEKAVTSQTRFDIDAVNRLLRESLPWFEEITLLKEVV